MKRIEEKLRQCIGLEVEALGWPTLERIISQRMQHLGVTTVDRYLEVLDVAPEGWTDLVESVVVAETWFFRDSEAFDGLLRFVLEEWLPRDQPRPLRLLSLPCSSGEEPYSMAMALLDAGLSPQKFQIDGVDISSRALERARRAAYGRNAFRNKDLDFRERHFRYVQERHVLPSSVTDLVTFHEGNVLDPGLLTKAGGYHCIFCRNLLIYLDDSSQAKALAHLKQLLLPGGVIFVGPAEQGVALSCGLVSARLPMGFTRPVRNGGPSEVAPAPHPVRAMTSLLAVAPAAESRTTPSLELGGLEARELREARKLADAGRLKEAALLCESYLHFHRDSPAAYYLLGLLKEAADQPGALECYRKALYLDPHHQDTLIQMALLAERGGDPESAQILRRRAERVKPGATESQP